MIPKIIHYCWFGRNPLPEKALRCIESWRRHLPDYEIVEWNEDNFDVNSIPYTAEAYAAGKYAFVSDYARFRILYEHGGLYFDTDVEVIRSFDDIVARGPFMGFETDCTPRLMGTVAPGLGLGAEAGHPIYKAFLDYYHNLRFLDKNGQPILTTIVIYTTEVLIRHGLENKPGIQTVDGISIYPAEFFNPFEWKTGLPRTTPMSHSIHWYAKTWMSSRQKVWQKIKYAANRLLGVRTITRIKRFIGISEDRQRS